MPCAAVMCRPGFRKDSPAAAARRQEHRPATVLPHDCQSLNPLCRVAQRDAAPSLHPFTAFLARKTQDVTTACLPLRAICWMLLLSCCSWNSRLVNVHWGCLAAVHKVNGCHRVLCCSVNTVARCKSAAYSLSKTPGSQLAHGKASLKHRCLSDCNCVRKP